MKLETKKTDNYSSVFWSFKIPFVKRTFRFHTILYKTPDEWVHGYSSRTEQGRYVLFQDYDNLDLEAIEQELKYLQMRFKLSDYYIFELDRENSYHAVCTDTFPMVKAYEILKETSCDTAFIHSIKRLQTKEWILRWHKKGERAAPKYLKTIESRYRNHLKSTAHANFLKMLGVPIKVTSGKGFDNCEKLGFVDYDTANRTRGKK